MRRAGLNVVLYPEPAKMQKQFKYADKLGMRVAVVIGPDEAAKGQVAVKNLLNGEQAVIPKNEAVNIIRSMI